MKPILLDQALPVRAAVILREDGWNALHAREIGMRDSSDDDILERAARESRVLISLDPDFHHILALTSAVRASVVLIRQQWLRASEVAPLVASICKEHEAALSEGCVLLRGVPY
jgi:predicted nuclease of predicted toxin-antitoxin system